MTSDFRVTLRALAAKPGFASIVVITLALGLGAAITVFSVAHAVLLRPLPFEDADQVVLVAEISASSDSRYVSPVTFDDWRTRQQAFVEIAAFRYWETVNLEDASGKPEAITLTTGTDNLFRALGVAPLIGRPYREEQNPPGGTEAVLSYELWQRRYKGDPAVLGRPIRIRGNLMTIVGVMPPLPRAFSSGWGDVWTCLYRYNIQEQRATRYRSRYLTIVGRRGPGVTLEQAASRMEALQRQLWTEPSSVAEGFDARLQPLTEALMGGVRLPLIVVTGAVVALLIVACANVATLMLVRASSRRRETATRLALGSSPASIVRLLVLENIVLAAAGGAVGLGVAWASLRALAGIGTSIPRFEDVGLSFEVIVFAIALSSISALVCSLAPLVELRRSSLITVLTESGRSGTPSARQTRLRRALVTLQMAMACALLVTSMMLVKSFSNVLGVDPGFEATRAVYLDLYLPSSRYPNEASFSRFYRDLLGRLQDLPSVKAAGGLLYFPYKPKLWPASIEVEGRPVPDGEAPVVYFNQIAGDYFAAMDIPLEAGRLPTEAEIWEPDSPKVVVINRAMARRLFGAEDAIGRRIRSGKTAQWQEIVGIVGDVRQQRLDVPPSPEYYVMSRGMPMPFQSIVVRGRTDRMVSIAEIRGVIGQMDPGIAIANLMPLQDWVRRHTRERQFALWVLSAFALVASVLGIVGVYGAVSHGVSQRRRELSVRLALGASPQRIRGLIYREGLWFVVAGGGAGIMVALGAAAFARQLLYGVSPFDIPTLVGVPALLAAAALLACWWPARVAAGAPLAATLRSD